MDWDAYEKLPEVVAARAKNKQFNDDQEFLYDLSDRLGISKDDLDRLIEIAKRAS